MVKRINYNRKLNSGFDLSCSDNILDSEKNYMLKQMNDIASIIGIDARSSNVDTFLFVRDKSIYLSQLSFKFQSGRPHERYKVLIFSDNEFDFLIKNPIHIFSIDNSMFDANDTDAKILVNDSLRYQEIISKYDLNNEGFADFISLIYDKILGSKYKLGILHDYNRIDNESFFIEFGTVIMNFLPYSLREQFSMSSRFIDKQMPFSVQIVNKRDDLKSLDAYYDIKMGKMIVNKQNIKLNDYFIDKILMPDVELTTYFESINKYLENLGNITSHDKSLNTIVLEAAIINQDISLFNKFLPYKKVEFISDLLSINTNILNGQICNLISCIDKNDKLNKFDLSYQLYLKSELAYVENNVRNTLIDTFKISDVNEQTKMITRVLENYNKSVKVDSLIGKFIPCLNNDVVGLIENILIDFYKVINNKDLVRTIRMKISSYFDDIDIENKINFFNYVYSMSENQIEMYKLIKNLLSRCSIEFYIQNINIILDLFIEIDGTENYNNLKGLDDIIVEVLNRSDESYVQEVVTYVFNKETSSATDNLLVICLKCIHDNSFILKEESFMKRLEIGYYESLNKEIKDIYASYLLESNINNILQRINLIYDNDKNLVDRKNYELVYRIVEVLNKKENILEWDILKKLIDLTIVNNINKLFKYLNNVYLLNDNELSTKIYSYINCNYPNQYSQFNEKLEFESFDTYYATTLNQSYLTSISDISMELNYISRFSYNSKSISKLNKLIEINLRSNMDKFKTDYKRYLVLEEYLKNLVKLKSEKIDIEKLYRMGQIYFWDNSSLDSFDFRNMNIYSRMNKNHAYDNHENVIMSKQFENTFKSSRIDWKQVYEVFISQHYIKDVKLKNNIFKGFVNLYQQKGLNELDENYLVLLNYDFEHNSVSWNVFFDSLEIKNIQVDKKLLNGLLIFKYGVKRNKAEMELKKYNNYNQLYPRYNSIILLIICSNIILYLLNVINQYFYIENIFIKSDLRNSYLLANYGSGLLIVLLATLFMIIELYGISKRKSNKFKLVLYISLIISYLLITVNVCMVLVLNNIILNYVISAISIIGVIGFNIYILLNMRSIKKEAGR